jgi:predicted metalloprotease with PDZ domain
MPGRAWRSVADTTRDPIVNARRPQPYASISRGEDYYWEGLMVWLEADQVIRKGTNGARGLDDFAKAFFGPVDGDWGVRTYEVADVVEALNRVYPYDWAKFLNTRINGTGLPAPLGGIEQAGYRLVWKDKPNPYQLGVMTDATNLSLAYSLGLTVDSTGKVTAPYWGGPAFNAGIVTGTQIVAVNGAAFTLDVMKAAITAAKDGKEPIQLLVKRDDQLTTVPVHYHGGLRYPWLEKAGSGETGLDRLLTPRTSSGT